MPGGENDAQVFADKHHADVFNPEGPGEKFCVPLKGRLHLGNGFFADGRGNKPVYFSFPQKLNSPLKVT
jgi:hypothetical protein